MEPLQIPTNYHPPATLLSGKTILVTGAGAGIGRAAARAYAAHGETGALIFSCNGRGRHMFDRPNHDIGCVQSAFDDPIPAAGFFALGEIGPVGRRNFLHGFTASVALIHGASDTNE